MLNIKSLVLSNYRNISGSCKISLAPVTIFTGPDHHGKTSASSVISLLRGMDMRRLPLRVSLNHSQPFGPDIQRSRKSRNRKLSIGLSIYNILLGEDLNVTFTLERDGSFDAQVTGISVSGKRGMLFDFTFEEGRISTAFGISAMLENLKETAGMEDRYREIERNFRDIRSVSGSYRESQENSNDGSHINIFQVDNDIKRKNVLSYLKEKDISIPECERLFYLFGSNGSLRPSSEGEEMMNMARMTVAGYDNDDVLLNDGLLKNILRIPPEEIGEIRLRNLIRDEYPGLYDCLLLLKEPALITRIVNQLRAKKYKEWEEAFVQTSLTTARNTGSCTLERELAESIENHFEVAFRECALFAAVTELNSVREGFHLVYNRYRNLRALTAFSRLVMSRILHDIAADLESSLRLTSGDHLSGLTVDFSHPMHGLLKSYAEIRKKDKFLKRWIRKFGIGEELNIEIPLIGLGYLPLIKRKDDNLPLYAEGAAANKMVRLLLELVNARTYCELRDYNDDLSHYPRTVVAEEPESGIQPAWQSKLADLFIDAGKHIGLHFMVETHSEYLIRKLQYLVASGQVCSENVIIYYFSNGCVREITISPDGTLSGEFGSGYFEEDDTPAVRMFSLKKTGSN